jgi:hypothetical protein
MSAFVRAVHSARLRTINAKLAHAIAVADDKNAALLAWLRFVDTHDFSVDPVLKAWVADHVAMIPNIPWVDFEVEDEAMWVHVR